MGKLFTTNWVEVIVYYLVWVGSGPSEPLLCYILHRQKLRTEIGQNRLIATIWSNHPPINRNKPTKPQRLLLLPEVMQNLNLVRRGRLARFLREVAAVIIGTA